MAKMSELHRKWSADPAYKAAYDELGGHFVCEKATMDKLRRIMTRLYDDRPLPGDERRDLANALHTVLNEMLELTE